MAPLEFNDLPSELHTEIFQQLKPYTLYNVSLTSKELNRRVLTHALWQTHLNSEFPSSLEKGESPFQKYTVCKRNSLKHFDDPMYRRLAILLEAHHVTECKELLPKCRPDCRKFLMDAIGNKSLTLMINEQKDPELKTLCFNFIKKGMDSWGMDNCLKGAFALFFGQFERLQKYPLIPTTEGYRVALIHGDEQSLDYLFLRGANYKYAHGLPLAAKNGNLETVKWVLEHGEKFNCDALNAAANSGNVEVLNYFLKTFEVYPEYIDSAIQSALSHGQPRSLEKLLPLRIDTNYDTLLHALDLQKSPNETHACLKLLLDKGAKAHSSLLFEAIATSSCNEIVIEMLLKNGANPNFVINNMTPLSQTFCFEPNKNIIEILLKHGAIPTNQNLIDAEEMLEIEPYNQELIEIVKLLKEKVSQ